MDRELKLLIDSISTAVAGMIKDNEGKFGEISKRLDLHERHLAIREFPGGSVSGHINSAMAREHNEKFYTWIRKGSDPDGLRGLEVQAGLSTVSDPDGGFTVPEELDRSIDKLAVDTVAMRQLARTTTASGDYKRLLSTGGATGGWVGEMEGRDETDTPELRQFNPPWSEWYALPEVTQVLLDDSAFDVAGWLLDELLDVETTMEGTAFIRGNGVKQPRGILSHETVPDADWEYGKIGYITSGHATLLNNTDKLIDLQHALKPAYRKSGVFLMNDATFATIRKLKDGEGNYLWRPGLAEGTPDTLLGKPVALDDNMDDIGAGKFPIAFADWKRAYLIGDHKAGRRLLRDPFTKKGWIKFYVTKRIFGGVINHQGIKLLKIAA